MKEIFKDIEGYEGLYQVSNLGNVKSLKLYANNNERILKLTKDKKGYLRVILYKEGVKKNHYVHRLVAQAFIENHNNLEQINHRDECKTNNHVTNLEWCDCQYNNNYGTRNQRAATSLSNINHPNRSKQVLCVETGVVYPSTIEVYRQLGFSQGNISLACRGKYKQAYGYTWQYVS